MFREWLAAGGDWEKVSLVYERKASEARRFKKGRKGMKERDILALYGEKTLAIYIEKTLFFFPIQICSSSCGPARIINHMSFSHFIHPRKTKDLLTKLRAKSMFEHDDDFPDDDEELNHFKSDSNSCNGGNENTLLHFPFPNVPDIFSKLPGDLVVCGAGQRNHKGNLR